MLLFVFAVVVPTILAFNVSPSATVLNQVASTAFWGALVVWLTFRAAGAGADVRRVGSLGGALALPGIAALWATVYGASPAALDLSALAFIAASGVVALAAATPGKAADDGRSFFWAWAIAGICSAVIALVQVFLPDLADGLLVARSGLVGRAVGNVRQPNHLSGLLLWSAVAMVPMLEAKGDWKLPSRVSWALYALFVFAIELSASRTGVIGMAVLALWGVADRRLSSSTRILLVTAPVVYALGWYLMSLWATESHHTFGAAARLAEKDLSGSRFGIWRDTLALIRTVPWTGVGWGEFNFAWSLTPFPHRPVAFFDHTHNLGLQLIVELGLPLGLLVIGLLLVALWQAFQRTWSVDGPQGAALRAAFVGVLLASIHSALEYPLWYGYFLLPTAWAWSYALGGGRPAAAATAVPEQRRAAWRPSFLRIAGALMLAGSLFALHDYFRVAQIFDPADDAKPLDQRIAEGQRSVFFAHHADYAAATVAEHPSEAWSAFQRAPHYLLDTRLMMAWAKAFAERGDLDRARHIAQRLREFHNPASDEFFAPCDKPDAPEPKPWQCQPPSKYMDWRDFQSLKY
jgi:O-antigen ligase